MDAIQTSKDENTYLLIGGVDFGLEVINLARLQVKVKKKKKKKKENLEKKTTKQEHQD